MEENTSIPFDFRGEGRAYFRIWIVNLFLSVISLGIYSAWAKVRSNRYLYSHLYLDGASFEYLAKPLGILVGRVIAVCLFASYTIVSRYFPDFTVEFFLILVPVVPWVLLKSLQFRANNTAYRNIRFHFHGTYASALVSIGLVPALVPLPFLAYEAWGRDVAVSHYSLMYFALCTTGFFVGVALHNYFRYIASNTSYGATRFTFESKVSEYFGMLTMVIFGVAALAILVIISIFAIVVTISALDISFRSEVNRILGGGVGLILYVWAMAMFTTNTTNLLYNGIAIPGWYRFKSDISSWGMFKVYFINTVLIIATLGMYIPFAKLRLIRYRTEHLQLLSTAPLDQFVLDEHAEVSATGQEVDEIFGVELSL
ncbi:MAG: DUF898 domain-containing protein [Pseudomonadales bacterium]|nr:DUF898 domain-containing protein [Pseudomonadales bacterium]